MHRPEAPVSSGGPFHLLDWEGAHQDVDRVHPLEQRSQGIEMKNEKIALKLNASLTEAYLHVRQP